MQEYKLEENEELADADEFLFDQCPYSLDEDSEDQIEIGKDEFIQLCDDLETAFALSDYETINEKLEKLSKTRKKAVENKYFRYFWAIRLYEKLNDVIYLPPSEEEDQSNQMNIIRCLEIISYYSAFSAQMAIGFISTGTTIKIIISFNNYNEEYRSLVFATLQNLFSHKNITKSKKYNMITMNAANGLVPFLIEFINEDLNDAEEYTDCAIKALSNIQIFASTQVKINIFNFYNTIIMDDSKKHLMSRFASLLQVLVENDSNLLTLPQFEGIISTISRLMFYSLTNKSLIISYELASKVISYLDQEHQSAFADCLNYDEISRSIQSSDYSLIIPAINLLCSFSDVTFDALPKAFESGCIENMMDVYHECDAQLSFHIMELVCRIICVGSDEMIAYVLDNGAGPNEIVEHLSLPRVNVALVLKALHRAAVTFPLFKQQLEESEDALEELKGVVTTKAEDASPDEKEEAEEVETIFNALMYLICGESEE